jgi:hypothetical protein
MPSINGRGNRNFTPRSISPNTSGLGTPGAGTGLGRGNRQISPSGAGRGPNVPGTVPGAIDGRGSRGPGGTGAPGGIGRRGPGTQGGTSGRNFTGRQGRGDNFRPGQARDQWRQNWNQHRGNWKHQGNWGHNNNWNWNNSNWWFGLFWYPGFAFGLNYGYWGFDDCGAYCVYSPYYYYGYPYVYAPRVVVADVPAYTYTPVPDYAYGSGYYMSQGAYSGLDAALADIRNAWVNGRADLMLRHVNAGTQVAIYLDNDYSYSLPGSDYSSMVKDAIGHIKTVNLTFDSVEQRSDGAYTATGTHEFYDANNKHKVVNVSFTLAPQGGKWVIVAAGSSESA